MDVRYFLSRIACITIAITYTSCVFASSEKKITICLDNYPPSEIHATKDNEKRGFAVDMLSDVYTKRGYEIAYQEAVYSRGLKLTQQGDCDILAQVIPDTEPDLLYSKAVTMTYKNAYFINSDSDWVYNGVDSLKSLIVGDVEGFDYSDDPPMEQFMRNPDNNIVKLYGDDASQRIIAMIANKRVSTVNMNTTVAWYLINKLGLQDAIKQASVGSEDIFISEFDLAPGFSPKSASVDELINIWDEERPKLEELMPEYLSNYDVVQ